MSNPATFDDNELPILLKPAVKSSNTFVGWFSDDAFTKQVKSLTKIGDITLYAKFETTRTITYTLNGGTNDEGNPATFSKSDLPITLLPATKEGFTFEGWFTEVGFENEIAEIDADADITVYAKFEAE